jgi:hypothetical protein
MKFIVFYSNKCKYCERLLEAIQHEQLGDFCQLICFDTSPEKIPDFINNVPTIVAEHLLKPLIGKSAEEWIRNKKHFNQITNNINTSNVTDPKIESALKEFEFNKFESSSISDHYTNITDTNIEKTMLEYEKIAIDAPITNDLLNKKISDTKIDDLNQKKILKERILLRKRELLNKVIKTTQLSKF